MDLCGSATELCGNVFGEHFGVTPCHINIQVFICLQFIEHIVDGNLDTGVFFILYLDRELNLVYKQVELLVFPAAYDRIHIVTEDNGVTIFIVSSLVKFQTDNLFFFYTLRKKILIKQIKKKH